jgi:hypothetical protein
MKQELIEHIKSQLNDLDLDYQEGAWERFQAGNKKKRKIVLWRKIIGAAAMLTIVLLLLPWQNFSHKNNGPIYQRRTRPVAICSSGPVTNDAATTKGAEVRRKITRPTHRAIQAALLPASVPKNMSLSSAADSSAFATDVSAASGLPAVLPLKKSDRQKRPIEELPATDHQAPSGLPAQPRWRFSLALGQALDSRSKTDFHIGTYVIYRVDRRFSISSGITYSQFGADKSFPLPEPSARSVKMMSSARAELTGIDIPLELQVKASNKIYARMGFSASAIITQRQTLNFSEQKVKVTTYVDPSGVTRSETVTISEVTTEAVAGDKLKQNRLAGFYNICVGYQQKIIKNYTIGLEPFVKIPIGVYSKQRLNLVQGGLRVKMDF